MAVGWEVAATKVAARAEVGKAAEAMAEATAEAATEVAEMVAVVMAQEAMGAAATEAMG